jgi:lipopolysaccharide/colanic/teichoic acid biosynthesis glycosyltransferase
MFLLVIIVLRMTGEGEVFYRQRRIGLGQVEFNILKFATMVKNSPNIGAGTITLQNDPRVLPVGRVLRKTKINELPQLFNILRGDMGIVGPRPLVPEGDANYAEDAARIIRSVRPGLTGMASLILRDEEGFYSHRQDAAEFYKYEISPYKQELELWYVRNRNAFMDLKIIVATAVSVMFARINTVNWFLEAPPMPKVMRDSYGSRGVK